MQKSDNINIQDVEYELMKSLYAPDKIVSLASQVERFTGFPVYFTNSSWEVYAKSPGCSDDDIVKLSELLEYARQNSTIYEEYLQNKAKLVHLLGESPAIVDIPSRNCSYLFAYSRRDRGTGGVAVFPGRSADVRTIPKELLHIILSVFTLALNLSPRKRRCHHSTGAENWSKVFIKLFNQEVTTYNGIYELLQKYSLIEYINSYVIYVFSVRSQNITETVIAERLTAYLETIAPYHFWFKYNGNIVMVMTDDSDLSNAKQLIQREDFKKLVTDNSLYVGYSNHTSHLYNARKAYESAITAARFSRRWDSSLHITAYEECKLYDLLSHLSQSSESAGDYLPISFLKIRSYDAAHHSEYFKTLTALIDCQFNKTRAASELFIQKSTLTYRMSQMHELFDLNWDDTTQMLHIQVGIYMLRYSLAD